MPLINGETTQEYIYEEYPKWITLPSGISCIAEDAVEEHRLLGTSTPAEIEAEDTATAFLYVPALDGEIATPVENSAVPDVCVDDVAVTNKDVGDDIETIRKQADALGLIYDKRWGALKLRQAIDGARARGALSGE